METIAGDGPGHRRVPGMLLRVLGKSRTTSRFRLTVQR
jgi:hypothetical protein